MTTICHRNESISQFTNPNNNTYRITTIHIHWQKKGYFSIFHANNFHLVTQKSVNMNVPSIQLIKSISMIRANRPLTFDACHTVQRKNVSIDLPSTTFQESIVSSTKKLESIYRGGLVVAKFRNPPSFSSQDFFDSTNLWKILIASKLVTQLSFVNF